MTTNASGKLTNLFTRALRPHAAGVLLSNRLLPLWGRVATLGLSSQTGRVKLGQVGPRLPPATDLQLQPHQADLPLDYFH